MKTVVSFFPTLRFAGAAVCLALTVGCAGPTVRPQTADARPLAARELSKAAAATTRLGTEEGRRAYNEAAANLTVLLREGNGGALWNQPLTLTDGGQTYQLRLAPGGVKGTWKPSYFTDFELAAKAQSKAIKSRNVQSGVGGALVGVRKTEPREEFAPRVGVTAAVTSTLDFQGKNVTLTLRDPSVAPQASVAGKVRPLEADFSAPLAYYPSINETLLGLMGAMQVSKHMGNTGLYMLQPYDPNRIPIVFVHGLISVPQIWRNVVNEIEKDPKLRGRFQMWVFAYPTGNPVAFSALRFREELEKARQRYGLPHGWILVGHSMGGLLSHMQVSTLTRADWHRVVGEPADLILGALPKDSTIYRGAIFNANPSVRRVVFICTPHRGSEMASGWIGQLGMRLVSLPASVAGSLKNALGNQVALMSGNKKLMPNGVTALKPSNPTLKVLDSVPLKAPHHSIIGDRGKGDSPNSTDGIVPYWSSHLDSAVSEKIVPGPHSSCELPQTIDELKRILTLQLKQSR